MEPPRVGAPLFIADANVLIDYHAVGIAILGRYVKAVGPVLVPAALLADEVEGLTEAACRRVGLDVIQPETAVLLRAAERAAESRLLSFYDWLVLLEAQHRRGSCLTNDGALIRTCTREGVPVVRGFAPLLQLVALRELSAAEALRLATAMAAENTYLVKVLPEFKRRLAGRL